MENINYYAQRLEFIIQLFRGHKLALLTENRDKISCLLAQYKTFEKDPSYKPQLPSTIETFIL